MPLHSNPATLRLALAQFKPNKADVPGNSARIRGRIVELAGESDLVIFPETALTGYFLEGGVQEVALSGAELAELLGTPPADAPDVVIGFYEHWRHRHADDGLSWRAGRCPVRFYRGLRVCT